MPTSYPPAVDDGKARHLKRGQRLPDIDLPSARGATFNPGRLQGRAVVFCYPWTGVPGKPNPPGWDDIPGAHGSTPEAEDFRNLMPAFEEMETAVWGLSTQEPAYQKALIDRLGLPFDIASDADLALQAALGLPTFAIGSTIYLRRLTLVVTDGRIERVYYPVHPPEAHAREVVAQLTAQGSYAQESRLRSAGAGSKPAKPARP